MPIGINSDQDFQRELDRLQGRKSTRSAREDEPPVPIVPQVQIVEKPHRGRKEDDINIPESLRKIIGETSVIDGPKEAIKLANQFGISRSSVSAYAKGATSTTSYNDPKPAILDHINKSRKRAIKRASNTLNASLGAITQEKLDYTDAKDLAIIAKNMSAIIKDLEPPQVVPSSETSGGPQFVIYAPQFKSETSFESIVVNE